jgi:hypothetical protein
LINPISSAVIPAGPDISSTVAPKACIVRIFAVEKASDETM